MSTNIADAFCAADADGCDATRPMPPPIPQKLDALEGEVKDAIASIPADKRTIITSHDAFGYFEHDYGLTFRAPEGISTEAEPSAADVAKLIDQVRQDKAAAIFVENITNHAADRADRRGDRPQGRRHALFRRAVAGRRPGRDLYRHDAAQHHDHQRRDPRELRRVRAAFCQGRR